MEPFTWKRQQEKALAKKLYREIQLSRNNKDHELQYPAIHKANPEHKVLKHCSPEREKEIRHRHEIRIKMVIPPVVDRPKRWNRNE